MKRTMKIASYNGSRKAYLCPAIHITDLKTEKLICVSLDPNEQEEVTTEAKRRRGIFDEGGDVADSKGIW